MSRLLTQLAKFFYGAPRDPFNPQTRKHIALVAFLAWIGLGADGLSSSCYGPEGAYIALGEHTHLSLYLAFTMFLTVFIISLAYNQAIELFPSGGGGYKAATQLVGPYVGLFSGAALIVDYVLTIAISIASGMDALFSLLPLSLHHYKLGLEYLLVIVFIILNVRGMKESIKVLAPIFLGFIVTHFALIIYGVFLQRSELPTLITDTLQETYSVTKESGWLFITALFLRAYVMGSGTYTGIEAVSNNVHTLAEPKVKTGKWTMFYMASSLSLMAGGFIMLYLLWNVVPVTGQTLNAVTFKAILTGLPYSDTLLIIVLALEAGLLLVAANTGFLAGPAVLANMAVDAWVPNRFRHLSSRLVTQNGIILFGLAALGILWLTHGRVALLVVLYSINVFLTFSLTLLGLSLHWWRQRTVLNHWLRRLLLSAFALVITVSILFVTLFEKFSHGGWLTVLITSIVIIVCLKVNKHYQNVNAQLRDIDNQLGTLHIVKTDRYPELDPKYPTAVLMIGKSQGAGMHTLLWVLRMFPKHFKNFIFVSVGVVDVESFSGKDSLEAMREQVSARLNFFVDYCHQHHLAATAYSDFGTDPIELLTKLAEKINKKFTDCIFFSNKLIFKKDNWLMRLLHNETPSTLQRQLNFRGLQLVIIPMKF